MILFEDWYYAPEPVDWRLAQKILVSASSTPPAVAKFLENFVKSKRRKK